MKIWQIALCTCLLAVSVEATENISPSLFGVSPGMTYEEAHKIVEFLPVGQSKGDGTRVGFLNKDVNGVLFKIHFTYDDEKDTLLSITASFPSSDYELISKTLTEKYGQGKAERSIVKTGMGVEHEQIDTYWLFSDSSIYLSRYSAKITDSFVGLSSDEAMRSLERRMKNKVDEMKKGL